eukprot:TRINITY_DN10220_c0_g1_i1.p3 TRINITY_DN10220_c0_g1~~TRINITY_DN10220_c0_g1_i1.p3  ORF type:complete len:103 (-),score=3.13 TRINITY_DN10220_c0_g1_i1:601-909(-)
MSHGYSSTQFHHEVDRGLRCSEPSVSERVAAGFEVGIGASFNGLAFSSISRCLCSIEKFFSIRLARTILMEWLNSEGWSNSFALHNGQFLLYCKEEIRQFLQ